jgi:hypothetical protein
MSQVAGIFSGHVALQVELPDAAAEVMPGVVWGAVEAFPTPAYWAYQVLARRVIGSTIRHRLGNSLHASGDADAAAQAFADVAIRHDSAVAWHNLARIRLGQGQWKAAQQAALRAVQRARQAEPAWLQAAQATLAQTGAAEPVR